MPSVHINGESHAIPHKSANADSLTAKKMIQQVHEKPNDTPILFVNFRSVPFEVKWDGKVQATLAPQETRWLPFWLAEHAAKHLVDDEMNDRKLPTDHHSRESFIAKCIGNKPGEKNEDPLGIKVLNENMAKAEVPKKVGRPKKEMASISDESKFEGK